ncbi:MAG TPA: hypothetical protein VNN10_15715 [Dehalococcoidia bacterium]|nr:hypothetical protein [Dehalococcoidia bacterium]
MALLSRILGKKKEAPIEAPPCPHKALVPRWDNPADMGKKDLVASYTCSACGSVFSREEGAALLGD